MSLKLKAISNTVFLSLLWFFSTIFSFLYWFVIAKNLSPENYGIISTSINLMLLLGSISSIGLTSAISKLIPEYSKKGQENKIASLINFSIKIISISNLILFLIMILFSSYFAVILKVSQGTIFIVVIGFIIFSFYYLSNSILYGYQNMRRVFKTQIIGDFIKFSFSSILILFGIYFSISKYPFGYFGPLIGTVVGTLIICLLRFNFFKFKTKTNSLDIKNIIFKYSLPAFVATLALLIFNNVPYLILTILKNPSVTGLFSMAMTVMSPIILIPGILNTATCPIISQLCVEKNCKKKQANLIDNLIRYSLFLVLPFATFLILFSKEMILLFSKTDYLTALSLFPILGIALIIFGYSDLFLSILYAIRKTKINRDIRIITAVIFLIFSIPLTYFFSAYGLSISYLISVFISMSLSYFFLLKYLPIKFSLKDFSKIILSTLIFISINYVSKILFENLVIKFFIAFLTGIFYLFTFILLKFYKKDDIELLKIIVQRSPKIFKNYINVIIKFLTKFV
jgi:O-antigen/teichoic acid export membrane protein